MNEGRARISLLICDDHRMLGDALATVVSADPEIELIAPPTSDPSEAVELCAELHPDVVLMDVEFDGHPHGIEATRRIKSVSSSTRVIVVSGHRRRSIVAEAVEAGASGYLSKTEAVGDVVRVVHSAADGEVLLGAGLLAQVVNELANERREQREATAVLRNLTKREREVLTLFGEGLRNDAIAERMFISPATVRTHIQNIFSKLGVHSKLEAVAVAARAGGLDR